MAHGAHQFVGVFRSAAHELLWATSLLTSFVTYSSHIVVTYTYAINAENRHFLPLILLTSLLKVEIFSSICQEFTKMTKENLYPAPTSYAETFQLFMDTTTVIGVNRIRPASFTVQRYVWTLVVVLGVCATAHTQLVVVRVSLRNLFRVAGHHATPYSTVRTYKFFNN
jgi:hypothetical protein